MNINYIAAGIRDMLRALGDQENESGVPLFRVGPREFGVTMNTEEWREFWSGIGGVLIERFVSRYEIDGIIYQMKEYGLSPVYLVAHPDFIKRNLNVRVDMLGVELGKAAGIEILGLSLVASSTVPSDTVIVADALSVLAALGVDANSDFASIDARLPILPAQSLL